MQSIIALFAPVLLSLSLYNRLHQGELSNRQLVFAFGGFSLLINLCSHLVIVMILGQMVSFEDRSLILYMIISAVFSVILPFVVNLIENSVNIDVEKNAKK